MFREGNKNRNRESEAERKVYDETRSTKRGAQKRLSQRLSQEKAEPAGAVESATFNLLPFSR